MGNHRRISGWGVNVLDMHFRISFDNNMGKGWWERAVICLNTCTWAQVRPAPQWVHAVSSYCHPFHPPQCPPPHLTICTASKSTKMSEDKQPKTKGWTHKIVPWWAELCHLKTTHWNPNPQSGDGAFREMIRLRKFKRVRSLSDRTCVLIRRGGCYGLDMKCRSKTPMWRIDPWGSNVQRWSF